MAKKLIKWAKITGVSILAIPAKVRQCRPWSCNSGHDNMYSPGSTVFASRGHHGVRGVQVDVECFQRVCETLVAGVDGGQKAME